MTRLPPPRLYGLPASEAPVVAVLRRGPTQWSQVGRWDLSTGRYEPGAWFHGRLFPRRSDLSPDGRYLCCFAHDPKARWEHGDSYVVVSRLPWLAALHAFGTCGTWSRGYSFASGADARAADPSLELPIPYVLQPIPVVQFANERRHGWVECTDSPPRRQDDAWDQHRNARIEKRQPGGSLWLRCRSVGHAGGAFGMDQAVDGLRVRYALEGAAGGQALDHLQWAEWDPQGRLLAATRDGHLQRWDLTGPAWTLLSDADLTAFAPDPTPPPPWARSW
jgi:hypothetical protein